MLAPLAEHLPVVGLHRRAPPVPRVQAQLHDHVRLHGFLGRVVGIVGVGQGPDPLARVGLADFAGHLVHETEDVVAGLSVIELLVLLLRPVQLGLAAGALAPAHVVHRNQPEDVAHGGRPGFDSLAVKVVAGVLDDLPDEIRMRVAHLRRLAAVALGKPIRVRLEKTVVVSVERMADPEVLDRRSASATSRVARPAPAPSGVGRADRVGWA